MQKLAFVTNNEGKFKEVSALLDSVSYTHLDVYKRQTGRALAKRLNVCKPFGKVCMRDGLPCSIQDHL